LSQGKRRLAAIMFTDIVGYTSLTQSNESATVRLLEDHRALARPFFTNYGGREIKTVGDAFMVEFGSALDATLCAIAVQSAMNDRRLSRGDKLALRIGIHVGDVIEKDGDVLGDAVNIASRIEPLAEPGGVCVTAQVYDQVKNKVPYPLVKIAARELKNVTEPVDVYRVAMPWEMERAEPALQLDPKRIAVLPFVSMSPDPNDEYFADGLTEELITKISLVSGMEVIARTSAMNYKKEKKNALQIGKELRVGTLLEGSVRKAGNRIRVSAQLIDANTEAHLWAESYDKNLDDIFEVQSTVAENVAGALKLRLLPDAKKRIQREGPKNPEAYVEYLKGVYFTHKSGNEAHIKAIEHFERALDLEHDYPEALALLGEQYGYLGYMGYAPLGEMYAKCREMNSRALELDEAVPEAHYVMARLAYYADGNWVKSEGEYKRALELNPNYVDALNEYAIFLDCIGRNADSIREIDKCLKLDPLKVGSYEAAAAIYNHAGRFSEALVLHHKGLEMDPDSPAGHTNLGVTYCTMGRTDDGVREFEKAMSMGGSFPRGNLGWAYALAGRREDARRLLEEIKAEPHAGQRSYSLACIYAALGEKEKALDSLEKAYQERAIFVWPMFPFEPALASLREEGRFKELVKKLDLDR